MKRTIVLSFIVIIFASCKEEPVKKPISPKVKIEFRMANENPTEGFEEKILDGKKIYLNPVCEMTQKDIALVYQSKDQNGYPTIFIELNKEGTLKFGSLTANNISKMLAILVNGNLILAPVIQSKIPGGKVQISGVFTETEMDSLFKSLTN